MVFCSLYSGSSGNSMFIASERAKILIDAGLPGKKIDTALQEINENPRDLNGIFITHEHSDHVKGVGVISRKYDIPIYANADTWSAMEQSIGKIKEHNIKIIDKRSITEIEDMNIKAFNIPGINYGCYGKDCHKWTERLYIPYSFEILPKLILKTLDYFLE